MNKIAIIFFTSKKNILSLLITISLIISLYILYLETSSSKNIKTHFFGAGFLTIPLLSFYLFYFNNLFRNNYFRFLNLNISKINFFKLIINQILFLSVLITILILTIYFSINYIYFKEIILNNLVFKNILFLFFLNLFLCLLSFFINSNTTSFWAFFGVIFYFLFEDLFVLFLKKNSILIYDFLPQQNFINVFKSENLNFFFIIPLIYFIILSLLIFKKNYKLL